MPLRIVTMLRQTKADTNTSAAEISSCLRRRIPHHVLVLPLTDESRSDLGELKEADFFFKTGANGSVRLLELQILPKTSHEVLERVLGSNW